MTISALSSLLDEFCPTFIQNLQTFELNALNLQGDDIFDLLNKILMKMTNLKHIKLIGTSISENLGELAEAFRRP